MTEIEREEKNQRASDPTSAEERYRAVGELSQTMIWEVDIPTRTLYQSEATSRKLGHSGSVFHDVPEGLLKTGTIHPDSVALFRRMYEDLYAGVDGKEYRVRSLSADDGYIWLRLRFQILRDGHARPARAVGVVERAPDIEEEMAIFEDEERLAQAAASDTLRFLQLNVTQDVIQKSTLPGLRLPMTTGDFRRTYFPLTHEEDVPRLDKLLEREHLLERFESGERWLFIDYRLRDGAAEFHWRNLAINLLRQPVSGDVVAFCYCRDTDARHRWAAFLKDLPQRDAATMLYTKESLEQMAAVAVEQTPQSRFYTLTVFELANYERIRRERGQRAADELLRILGRFCRILVDGSVMVAHLTNTEFAVFRVNSTTPEEFHTALLHMYRGTCVLAEKLLHMPLEVFCGYTVSTRESFCFDEMLRQACVACRVAGEQPGTSVVAYTPPEEKALSPKTAYGREKRRVLLADDDPISRTMVRINLEREYAVDEAADGQEAIELLQKNEYALLLSDIQMPRRSGWELLAAMREENRLLRTPVIMITADGGQESEVKALNLGASDVIVKPIVPEVLLSRARNIIGRQEAAAAMERNALYELRFQQQAALLRQADYDELTGLYNKRGFLRRAREKLAAQPQASFQVLRWDLDHFKLLNDMLGMEAGDRLLRDIGAALRERICPDQLCARFDADRFVTLLAPGAPAPEEILSRLGEWFKSCDCRFELSAHMGVYPVTDRSVEVSIMCDRAALAVQSVKGSFTNRVGWYDEALRAAILEEQTLTSEMEGALAQKQFVLYFQPQINYATGALSGAEVLVRWRHPQRGLIPPAKFIPLFERNGFITRLDEYVWEESCRYLRRWMDEGRRDVPVSLSVNISRTDVFRVDLRAHFTELIRRYDLPADALRLEITESAYMQSSEQLIGVVRELRAAGFTVEMDDFGAGYSSLNTLKDVPVNVLKLDMRFLSGGDTERGRTILSAIIRMAHGLGMEVIAEGVEQKEQADDLKELECRYMQGYYFSRPVEPAAFERLLPARELCDRQSAHKN